MSSEIAPFDQKKVSCPVPPEAVRSIKPKSPGQFKSVFWRLKTIAGGSVRLSVFEKLQPFASVISRVKMPAFWPEILAVVAPVDQSKTYGIVPPETAISRLPSELPAQVGSFFKKEKSSGSGAESPAEMMFEQPPASDTVAE